MSVEETTQHDSTYSWVRLAISFAVGIVGNIGMWAIVVVLPGIQDEFGVGRADVTFPVIGMMLGFASAGCALSATAIPYNSAWGCGSDSV